MNEQRTTNRIDALSRARALHDTAVTPENHLAIREILDGALGMQEPIDPQWEAEARVLLADALVSDYLHGWNAAGDKEIDQAEREVEKALEITSEPAFGHYVRGFVRRARGDHRAALKSFQEALDRDPDMARAYAQQANELINVGEPEKAPALVRKAIALSPRDPSMGMFYWIIGRAYFFCGAYHEAIPWLEKSVIARPNVWYNRLYLVSAYALQAEDTLREFKTHFFGYSLDRVQSNETRNRTDDAKVKKGRAKFHDGLRRAGLAASEGRQDA
jgi:adenylate cyclase